MYFCLRIFTENRSGSYIYEIEYVNTCKMVLIQTKSLRHNEKRKIMCQIMF